MTTDDPFYALVDLVQAEHIVKIMKIIASMLCQMENIHVKVMAHVLMGSQNNRLEHLNVNVTKDTRVTGK